MYIVGTDRIKGVVQLDSIKQTVTRGQRVRVADKDLENQDIEIALRMGYVRKQGERKKPKSTAKATGGNHYVCRPASNIKSPISLSFVEEEIQPGEEFMVDEPSRRSEEFEAFYKNGIVEIVRAVEPPALTEKAITMSDLFEEEPPKKKPSKTKKTTKKTSQKKKKAEQSGEEKVQPQLDTNEEVKVVATKKTSAKKRTAPPDPGTSQSETDAGKPVVWNPSKAKVGDKQIEDATVWTPSGPKKAGKNANKAPQDVAFVDQEQEKARIDSHPKLKGKGPVVENDPGFVDHEQEQERIESNPKLRGKAKAGGDDLDLLEI